VSTRLLSPSTDIENLGLLLLLGADWDAIGDIEAEERIRASSSSSRLSPDNFRPTFGVPPAKGELGTAVFEVQ
jgi:hypothetical protein